MSGVGRHRARGRAGVLVAAGLALLAGPAAADIYRYVDGNGVVHFTDRPGHAGYKLFLRTPPAQTVRGTSVPVAAPAVNAAPARRAGGTRASASAREYSPLVDEASRRWGVNPALIHAVIRAESNYDPEALSHAGAMGLMQLMPGTARRFGVADPWDPEQNVHGGTRYLRELLDRFRSLKLALAAYNAGEGAVEQHGNQIPPYEETQTYVDRVMGIFFRNLDRDS
jgi:soluble lytic murein transglycosylase-like protein